MDERPILIGHAGTWTGHGGPCRRSMSTNTVSLPTVFDQDVGGRVAHVERIEDEHGRRMGSVYAQSGISSGLRSAVPDEALGPGSDLEVGYHGHARQLGGCRQLGADCARIVVRRHRFRGHERAVATVGYADTIAAMVEARYGLAIPSEWRRVEGLDRMVELGEILFRRIHP